MELKKDTVRLFGGIRARIESGPWPGPYEQVYLVERLDGLSKGKYMLANAAQLNPIPPQVGDLGRFGHSDHLPLRRLVEANDEYVVGKLVEANPDALVRWSLYSLMHRNVFDREWEPQC